MPIRNMWSLNPGEVLTAERVSKEIPDCQVYFPLHDKGIDLSLVRGKKHCSIQVKESRLFESRKWSSSWHQVSGTNVDPKPESRKIIPDFFVFLTYFPQYGETKLSKFDERYIIIPTTDLREKLHSKKASKGKYSFYFVFSDDGEVWDTREHTKRYEPGDGVPYTAYLENWHLVEEALSSDR